MDLPTHWKARIRRALPWKALNAVLFHFPSLYKTRLVHYESHLSEPSLTTLLGQIDGVADLPGDIIECGSAHCGTSVAMALYAASKGITKLVFACDSYEGFDRDELERERAAGLTASGVSQSAFTSTSYDYVQRKIHVLGLDDRVIPVRGYFQDTLPKLPGPYCLAFVDCDLRDSLVFAAEAVWPKLSVSGRIVFDDYANPASLGAKEGVDTFVLHHAKEIVQHGTLGPFYYAIKDIASRVSSTN
jgi:hypothetical protein